MLVIINSSVFIIFAFSFAKPHSPRDWRSFGAFSAFPVALLTVQPIYRPFSRVYLLPPLKKRPLNPRLIRGITMQTELLKVTGMTCGGCSNSVTNALKAVHGVDAVNVSLSGGEATVQYDELLTSPHQLKAAVINAGYGIDAGTSAQSTPAKGGCCGC